MKKLALICTLFLGSALCVAVSSAGSGPSFAAAKSYPAGSTPASVAVGDLNGDGKVDLATANSNPGTLSVLLNDGTGALRAKVDYPAGSYPVSVGIGDLNGDGKADLVTGNMSTLGRFPSRDVAVLLNRGDGTFAARAEYSIGLGHGQLSVAVGDLNGDGRLDVAAADDAHDSVSVLMNSGNGGLQPPVDYAAGWLPEELAIGDLNGDGRADLATANTFGSSVSVLLNNGNGGFLPKVDYAAGSNPSSVAIGDLNGDGKADLATANGPANTVSMLLGRGNGSFSGKVDLGVGSGPAGVAIADLNGDRKLDLATADSGAGTVTVLSQGSAGRFQAGAVRTGVRPVSIASGDLNGDGRPDLVTANLETASVSVLVNATVNCTVPRVVKKALPAAKRALGRAHCRAGKLRRISSKLKRGKVVSQTPRPGTIMPGGGRVNLVLSRGRRSS